MGQLGAWPLCWLFLGFFGFSVGICDMCIMVGVFQSLNSGHRIIEALSLEKTSKVTKSNQQPSTTMFTTMSQSATSRCVLFEHFQER